MRRMIAGAKNALHGNTQQNDLPLATQNTRGYTCWDNTQCGICSRFLDRWFILDMFTSRFVEVGETTDLLKWSQAGCDLCKHIYLLFVEAMKGAQMPLDANIIVRWDTQDRAIKDGRKDEIISFNFELSWGLGLGLHGQARSASLNCFTNQGKLILDMHYFYFGILRPLRPANGPFHNQSTSESGYRILSSFCESKDLVGGVC